MCSVALWLEQVWNPSLRERLRFVNEAFRRRVGVFPYFARSLITHAGSLNPTGLSPEKGRSRNSRESPGRRFRPYPWRAHQA